MASIDLLVAFMIATITYAIVPGPGTFYIAAQTIAHDPLAALRGALGLHLGGYVIVVCSAAGLTALFAVVPMLYEGLKLLGAAYLVWLGIRIILFLIICFVRSHSDMVEFRLRTDEQSGLSIRIGSCFCMQPP